MKEIIEKQADRIVDALTSGEKLTEWWKHYGETNWQNDGSIMERHWHNDGSMNRKLTVLVAALRIDTGWVMAVLLMTDIGRMMSALRGDWQNNASIDLRRANNRMVEALRRDTDRKMDSLRKKCWQNDESFKGRHWQNDGCFKGRHSRQHITVSQTFGGACSVPLSSHS